jgi:hypothetical protein
MERIKASTTISRTSTRCAFRATLHQCRRKGSAGLYRSRGRRPTKSENGSSNSSSPDQVRNRVGQIAQTILTHDNNMGTSTATTTTTYEKFDTIRTSIMSSPGRWKAEIEGAPTLCAFQTCASFSTWALHQSQKFHELERKKDCKNRSYQTKAVCHPCRN